MERIFESEHFGPISSSSSPVVDNPRRNAMPDVPSFNDCDDRSGDSSNANPLLARAWFALKRLDASRVIWSDHPTSLWSEAGIDGT